MLTVCVVGMAGIVVAMVRRDGGLVKGSSKRGREILWPRRESFIPSGEVRRQGSRCKERRETLRNLTNAGQSYTEELWLDRTLSFEGN